MAKGPKKKCCLSKPRCTRCPLRMLAEGTLPTGYTVHKRRLIPPDPALWPEAKLPDWELASPRKTAKAKKKKNKKKDKSGRGSDATAAVTVHAAASHPEAKSTQDKDTTPGRKKSKAKSKKKKPADRQRQATAGPPQVA